MVQSHACRSLVLMPPSHLETRESIHSSSILVLARNFEISSSVRIERGLTISAIPSALLRELHVERRVVLDELVLYGGAEKSAHGAKDLAQQSASSTSFAHLLEDVPHLDVLHLVERERADRGQHVDADVRVVSIRETLTKPGEVDLHRVGRGRRSGGLWRASRTLLREVPRKAPLRHGHVSRVQRDPVPHGLALRVLLVRGDLCVPDPTAFHQMPGSRSRHESSLFLSDRALRSTVWIRAFEGCEGPPHNGDSGGDRPRRLVAPACTAMPSTSPSARKTSARASLMTTRSPRGARSMSAVRSPSRSQGATGSSVTGRHGHGQPASGSRPTSETRASQPRQLAATTLSTLSGDATGSTGGAGTTAVSQASAPCACLYLVERAARRAVGHFLRLH